MTFKLSLFVFVFFHFLIISSRAEEKKELLWGVVNLPPNLVIEGPRKGEGAINLNMELIKKELPQYSHKELAILVPRVNIEAQERKNYCCPMLFKTPDRDSIFHFSKRPIIISGNRGIILRKDRKAEILKSDAASISFEDLLKTGKFTGMIAQGRKQGKSVDELIEKYKDKIKYRNASEASEGLFEMLKDKRIDYTIGSFHEMKWITKDWSDKDSLSFISIKEAEAVTFSPIFIGCSKNDFGKSVIADIDKAMEKLVKQKEFEENSKLWAPNQDIFGIWYKKLVLDAGG